MYLHQPSGMHPFTKRIKQGRASHNKQQVELLYISDNHYYVICLLIFVSVCIHFLVLLQPDDGPILGPKLVAV